MSWSIYIILLALLLARPSAGTKTLPQIPEDSIIGSEKGAIHIVTTIECGNGYFVYQAWAQKYSLEMVNQPGNYTRIISCDNPDSIKEEDLNAMDTIIVPNWTNHPTSGDVYQPYNRPIGIMYWLAARKPTAEWTLILDPDMILRQPFLLKDFAVPEGFVASSEYSYLHGAHNELAEHHVKDVPRKNDTYGGPIGRRADKAGAFYFIRTRDLIKLTPLWLKFTEDVRADPQAWKLAGDDYVKPGGRVWISEMYGYIFAAAKAGLRHKAESVTQCYPCYEVRDIPVIVHYGLNHTLGEYWFDKHVHMNFDAMKCPSWNLSFHREAQDDGGLFPHPPSPSSLTVKNARQRYGDLLLIEVVNTINQALCRRHQEHCPSSQQLEKECGKVASIAEELSVEFDKLHIQGVICHDDDLECKAKADNNKCELDWTYMTHACRGSCKKCREYIPRTPIEHQGNQEQEVETLLKNKEEQEAFEEAQAQQKMLISRGKVGFLTSKTVEEEQEDSTDEIRNSNEVQDIIILEDPKKNQNTSVNNEAEEISRCQELEKEKFFADPKCIELERLGLVNFDHSSTLKISMEDDARKREPSGNGFYTFVAIAMFIAIIATIIRSWPSQKERKNTYKRQ